MSSDQGCCICMNDIQECSDISITACSHRFHTSCLMEWSRCHATCPFCRYQLYTPSPPQPDAMPSNTPPTTDRDIERQGGLQPFVLSYAGGSTDDVVTMTRTEYKRSKIRYFCYGVFTFFLSYTMLSVIAVSSM